MPQIAAASLSATDCRRVCPCCSLLQVCDFGMSHVLEDAASAAAETGMGKGMGSPQWSAPEKLRGGAYDETADSYSYGIVMFEVLSRSLPYAGRDQYELMIGIITRMLPRPALTDEQAQRWPRRLPSLMAQCMREEPSERPDFNEVRDCRG